MAQKSTITDEELIEWLAEIFSTEMLDCTLDNDSEREYTCEQLASAMIKEFKIEWK